LYVRKEANKNADKIPSYHSKCSRPGFVYPCFVMNTQAVLGQIESELLFTVTRWAVCVERNIEARSSNHLWCGNAKILLHILSVCL